MSTLLKTTNGPAVSSRAPLFLGALDRLGYSFHAGVPCSILRDVIAGLEARGSYVAAAREDLAVGFAAGAALAGRKAALYMQNSGLCVASNALASLSLLYEIPALLVVSWRGHGPDAPEHALTGALTPDLFRLLGIPFRVLDPEGWEGQLIETDGEIGRTRRPAGLLVRKGVL